MIRARRGGLIALTMVCCTMIGGAAAADGRNSTRKPPDSVQTYGLHDKGCLEWTDSCVNCIRAGSKGDFSCSNIGIACQPKPVECLKRSVEKKAQ
jgi:hypothetical protein